MSDLTSKLTIRELPNELMIKVLRYLDQRNLKNATLTCKHWCNLIESSCQWSIHLDASIDASVDASVADRLDFMLTTNRKFGTIQLAHLQSLDVNKILDIFQRHGLNVVKLRLMYYWDVSIILFAELFKLMPNLIDVYMFGITPDASDRVPQGQDLPELKKLKILEMDCCESSFVKYFQKAKLTTLSFKSCQRLLNCELLEDFLKSQRMLTSLTLEALHYSSYSTPNLFYTEKWSTPMPFQLTHFSLLIEVNSFPIDYKFVVKFLEPQAKTLKKLEIGNSFPGFVYEFVFASMTKLNTLSIRMNDMPRDMAFYERLKENRSITKLILEDGYIDEMFPNFVKKLPNVRTFIARHIFHHTLPVIAQGWNKLESLATCAFNGRLFNDVRLPNLKILQIPFLSGKVEWNKFMKAHAQLTELTIETIFDESLNSFDIDQIMSNVSLQSLRLGVGFIADELFFNIIRNKCPDLKVLDLHKSCMPDTLKDNIDCKVLRLCDTIKCSLY